MNSNRSLRALQVLINDTVGDAPRLVQDSLGIGLDAFPLLARDLPRRYLATTSSPADGTVGALALGANTVPPGKMWWVLGGGAWITTSGAGDVGRCKLAAFSDGTSARVLWALDTSEANSSGGSTLAMAGCGGGSAPGFWLTPGNVLGLWLAQTTVVTAVTYTQNWHVIELDY